MFSIYATTLSGLEEILASEIKNLGGENVATQNRLVTFEGDQTTLYKANLWCRTAIRILKPIAFFSADNEKKLYSEIQKINWSKYLSIDGTLAIDAIVHNSYFTHSLYVAQLVKDAIVDQFRENHGQRPSVDLKNPDLRLSFYMNKNEVTVSMDSSGDSLHKRGYRIQTHSTPINEVLAAGIIMSTNWDINSSFVDGMCGTGTFLIEAAMLALNIAPGYWRKSFGFMNWLDYNQEIYSTLYQEMLKARKNESSAVLCGCEVNRKTSIIARENIENAGLDHIIKVQNTPFEEFTPPLEVGTIIMNPPYGTRTEVKDIEQKYKMIGDVLKQKYSGYKAYVFTGNLEMAKKIGLRASRRIPLHNGALDCRLLFFDMYKGTKRTFDDKEKVKDSE